MAVEFRKNAARDTLYNLAVENGIEVAEDADRAEIIAALEAYNAQDSAQDTGEGNSLTPGENAAEDGTEGAESGTEGEQDNPDDTDTGDTDGDAPQDGAESPQDGADDETGDNTTPDENAPQSGAESAEGYDVFVYAGPTLPRGRLKENTVFRGTFDDVCKYLAPEIERFPQIPRLIVPTNRLAKFAVKVKTPGNIAHKYYTDIVSAMRTHKEV